MTTEKSGSGVDQEGSTASSQTDTARMDWLEANPGVINPENAVSPGWNMEGFHDEEEGWGSEELNLWRPTLRKAIDKALELAVDRSRSTPKRT